jgi:hypothetical protein
MFAFQTNWGGPGRKKRMGVWAYKKTARDIHPRLSGQRDATQVNPESG